MSFEGPQVSNADNLDARGQPLHTWPTGRLPVYDALGAEVAQSQGQLADVELHGALREVHVLLEVVAQVSAQQEVHHHEHVFLVLEGVPAEEEEEEHRDVAYFISISTLFGTRCSHV